MPAPYDHAVQSGPRVLLRLEGAASFLALSFAYFAWSGQPWLLFGVAFFIPDLTMAAYLVNDRVGAAVYNTAHTYIGPVLLGGAGLLLNYPLLPWLAAIWGAHIGFDRLMGYGLKYASGFKFTHLGTIGTAESPPASPAA